MRIERRLGDRLKVEVLPVLGLTPSIHHLLESDLAVAWGRIVKTDNPAAQNPRFQVAEGGWSACSVVTGEKLASFSLVPPKRGRPRP